MSTVDKIYWLLEDCKRYGTLPFSGLARAGFIAVQFLRGFVKLNILSTGLRQVLGLAANRHESNEGRCSRDGAR